MIVRISPQLLPVFAQLNDNAYSRAAIEDGMRTQATAVSAVTVQAHHYAATHGDKRFIA
ncbi:hypothetical protein [Xanthomonas sp. 3793]|uniref:Uncharacterized protein n=1 Tax=Xanthomonas sp. 10-10 TaxID=3115848 RepID=A0AAU7P554_9XANT|nr:hypothetical protein [Xanthomonas sp. 3793]MCS3745422.1 hypothetical protein [Xanthomonas sp. 3793]